MKIDSHTMHRVPPLLNLQSILPQLVVVVEALLVVVVMVVVDEVGPTILLEVVETSLLQPNQISSKIRDQHVKCATNLAI